MRAQGLGVNLNLERDVVKQLLSQLQVVKCRKNGRDAWKIGGTVDSKPVLSSLEEVATLPCWIAGLTYFCRFFPLSRLAVIVVLAMVVV